MSALGTLYRGRNDLDFPRMWKPVLIVAGLLLVAGMVSLVRSGLNLSIDFEGGAVWEVPTKTLTVREARDVLATEGVAAGSKVQEVTDPDGTRILRIQADSKDIDQARTIAGKLAEAAGVPVGDVGTNTVGPSWGEEITGKAVRSLLVFLVLIAVYIAWQLEWRMAVGALVAVIHDIGLTVGIYSIFQLEVTPATVIAFLTILGYSIYDTIVVYDRLYENSARYDRSGAYTYTAIMRRSLNQVLMRSINTTVSSILPVVALLVVGSIAFGQRTLQEFSLVLLIGMLAGAFSSMFIAAPVVAWLKEREPKYARVRARAMERGDLARANRIPVVAAETVPVVVAETRATSAASAAHRPNSTRAAQYQRPHPPRPRKQGRKR